MRGAGAAALMLALLWLTAPLFAAVSHDKPPGLVENPGTDLWREVRRRAPELQALQQAGKRGPVRTQVQGVDTTRLINARGEQWRLYRHRWLIPGSLWLLGGVAALVVLLYLAVALRLPPPRESGRRLLRFETYERTLHWFMAALFLFLGLTGLLLLWGRPLLIPLLGKPAFSAIASASKEGHNLMGPVFLVSLLLFFARFWRRNLYQRGDFAWLARLGGLLGRGPLRVGFFNLGEKVLFWLVVLVGLAISLAGLVLLFPNFGQGRVVMEAAHLVHTLGAVLLLAVVLGHIYMAKAVKGTLEGMTGGYVEYNWAREHHGAWAADTEAAGRVLSVEEVESRRGQRSLVKEGGT